MRAAEIREMSNNEIEERLEESREELWNYRFKHATNQLENTSQIGNVRKVVARLQTVLREREIWAEYEAAQEG